MASNSRKRENKTTGEEQQQQQHNSKRQNQNNFSLNNESIRRVKLNPADCDLAFNIEGDGLTGHGLYEFGFAYWWSGARGDVGVATGKYCFGCRIIYAQPVTMEDDVPLDQRHICRIGISRGDDPVGNLGETEHSFGYDGTGKFSNGDKFVEYGECFGVGDTIVCLIDLESKPYASLEFCKNGEELGVAIYFKAAGTNGLEVIDVDSPARNLPWESAFFPHVLLKNTVVRMQFSIEDGLVPKKGYKPWDTVLKDGKAIIGPGFSDPIHREVIMMVGLPAAGKTTWVEERVQQHPEKRYIVLGTNLALDHMKVPGLKRKRSYVERFDRLMDRAGGIFYTLLSRAAKVSRNYIIDQTNVYKSARIRKLKPFFFFRKIAVVVFPRLEELKLRTEKRYKEMGKEVPSEAVNEMLANFELPMSNDMHGADEYFEEVIFTYLSRDEAQQQLNEFKCDLKLSFAMQIINDPQSSRILASFIPGSGTPYSGHVAPSLGLQTRIVGSWAGQRDPTLQPNTPRLTRGYTGFGQHDALESGQQHPYVANIRSEGPSCPGILEPAVGSHLGSLNPMLPVDGYPGTTFSTYNNHVPGDDRGCPSYRDPVHGTKFASGETTFAAYPGNGGYAGGPSSVYQTLYALPYGTPNPRPQVNSTSEGPWCPGMLEPAAGPDLGSLNPMPLIDGYPGIFSSYSNHVPGEDRAYPTCRKISGIDPAQYGTLGNGKGNHVEGPRSAYGPPHVLPDGTPNPRLRTGVSHPETGV